MFRLFSGQIARLSKALHDNSLLAKKSTEEVAALNDTLHHERAKVRSDGCFVFQQCEPVVDATGGVLTLHMRVVAGGRKTAT